jgi:photosystem II stability/assembly factor-like uncharacterized protein
VAGAAVGVTLLSDTVAFNSAASAGGGLDAATSQFALDSTLVAANTAGSGADASGTVRSSGHNLIGQTTGSSGWVATDVTGTAAAPLDPRLGDFASFGGPTRTVALLNDSPAAGLGDPAGPATDQRGAARSGTAPSIGAFELERPSSFVVFPSLFRVQAGHAFSVTVSAVGSDGHLLAGYIGTVHFGGSDPDAILPVDYTFTLADAGTHTFTRGVTLQAVGAQTVTVTGDGVSGTATVTATQLGSFQVAPSLTTVTTGVPFGVTVSAVATDGGSLTDYAGTVHFSSSDPDAVLPADYTFTPGDAGRHTFTQGVTLHAPGAQDLSVSGDGITGTATVTVVTRPSTLVNPVSWTALGPAPIVNGQTAGQQPVSGRISAIAGDPHDPNVLYLAAAGGGVWKTTDAGADWTPLTDDQVTAFMGALAVAPSDPNVLYAGTGEATNSALSFTGRGVLKSTDGGATWTLVGQDAFNRHTIAQVVVSPVDPDTVYVALAGSGVNGLGGNTGIWKSTDGGLTWTDTTAAISTTAAFSDVEIDPTDAQTLYAALGSFRGSAVNGVYKTTDGGATWSVAGNFPMGLADGRITVAIAPADPQTLYVSVSGSGQAGTAFGHLIAVMKSTDGGATWAALPNTPDLGGSGWYGLPLAVDPLDVNTLYASAGGDPIVESNDGGRRWFSLVSGADGNGPHPDHHAFAFDANGKLLDGNDGGIWRLDNPARGSVHWADLNTNLQLTQYIGIALDPTSAGIVYGGSQDNGTTKFTDALSWQLIRGGDGGFVRVDPSNPSTVYHDFGNFSLERSDNGGVTWVSVTNGINRSDPSSTYVPYVLDPANPSRLLLGTNRVYETTNRGGLWRPISTPFSGGWTVNSNINSLATAAADRNTVYASAGGHIFVTFDDGLTWQERDIPGVSDDLHDLQVDPADPLTAYAVRDRFGGGKVFKTTDGGLSWTDISGDLPDVPAFTLALDPRSNTLYVGMDDGVYVSTDQGNTWSRFGAGLPHGQVRDLELNTSLQILAAGTHGRGVWEILVPAPEGSGGAHIPLASEPALLPSRPTRMDLGVPGPKSSETLASLNFSVPQGGSSGRPSMAGITDNGIGTFTPMGTQLNSVGVATGDTPVSVNFTLPAGLPEGAYSLSVVANGIASDSMDFIISSGGAMAAADPLEGALGTGSGDTDLMPNL